MLIRTRWVNVSRRGAFLALFGVVFVLIGYSYLNIPEASKPVLKQYFRTALEVAPIQVYGWAWIVCGVLAVVGGVIHRLDWLGFAAAAVMPALWSLVSFVSQWVDDAPRAWISGLVYLAIAGAILIVAGMVDSLDIGRPHRHWWLP